MKCSHQNQTESRALRLLEAAGELDDALIREAETVAATRRGRLLRRLSAVAACFLVLAVLVPTTLFLGGLPAFDVGGDAAPDKAPMDGGNESGGNAGGIYETYSTAYGLLVYHGVQNGRATLTLTLHVPTEPLSLCVSATAAQVVDGETRFVHYYGGIDPTPPHADAQLLSDAVTVTLDGAPVSLLPTAAGVYDLTLDLSVLAAVTDGFSSGGAIRLGDFPAIPLG